MLCSRSPERVTREYRLRTTIYRHANVVGLFCRRKEQFGRVLGFNLDQAKTCTFEEANLVIRAARIYAHLDHNGKWIESPLTNYIFHGPAADPSAFVVPSESAPADESAVHLRSPQGKRFHWCE